MPLSDAALLRITSRDRADKTVRTYTCACGRALVVAWVNGAWAVRCGLCGPDPPTKRRTNASTRKRLKRGESLFGLEAQTLERQLRKEIRLAESSGERAYEAETLLARLEGQMDGQTPAQALTVAQERRMVAYTPREMELLKNTLAPGLSDDELGLFIAVAQHRKLDPFAKQIYAIKRRTYNQETRSYEDRMVIQTGIDGYRAIASRNERKPLAGVDDPQYGPDVTDPRYGEGKYPEWCRMTVYQIVQGHRVPITATVRFAERVQMTGKAEDRKPNSMWASQPYGQLAKCCESMCLRKGWPEDLGDIEYADAAPEQSEWVDHATGELTGPPQAAQDGADGAAAIEGDYRDVPGGTELGWEPEPGDLPLPIQAFARIAEAATQDEWIAARDWCRQRQADLSGEWGDVERALVEQRDRIKAGAVQGTMGV